MGLIDAIKNIAKSPAKEMVTGVINGAADVVDRFVQTPDERAAFKVELEKEISKRWSEDMASDSFLSKNVRPLTLIFLIISTVLIIFIDSGMIDFKVNERWISLLETVLMIVIGAYFGGRSFEKIKKK
jgi:hypothetical protein|tara:strand:- start:256 stop:639 length:384 start_codon:yes stop_codon:yes gene_type:complete